MLLLVIGFFALFSRPDFGTGWCQYLGQLYSSLGVAMARGLAGHGGQFLGGWTL